MTLAIPVLLWNVKACMRKSTRFSFLQSAINSGVLISLVFIGGHIVFANPQGESVASGGATFDRNTSQTLQINASDHAIINWQDFSINSGELTQFFLPSSTSAVLNRVTSGNPSSIMGNLSANGQVYLINPNGVLVGSGAKINTGGFVASTLDIKDSGFLSGKDMTFSGTSVAGVENRGSISAIGGDVFLISRTVKNDGSIQASQGTVGLASGSEVLLKASGQERLFVQPSSAGVMLPVGVKNSGMIQAAQAELKSSGNMYAMAINNEGLIQASGVYTDPSGRVFLTANGGDIQTSGSIIANNLNGDGGLINVDGGVGSTVMISGQLKTAGEKVMTSGGRIQVTGEKVALVSATVDASGKSGGGTVLIGGDYQGKGGGVQNASKTYVSHDSTIDVSATDKGNGGKSIIWSNDGTMFYGTIFARGGVNGGNGGFVETSGKDFLEILGAKVDASATFGNYGSWLLDPRNVTIAGATANGAFGGGNPDIFTPTADNATIDVATINASLDGGTSVSITTGSTGTQNGDITINSAITKSAGATDTLTLTAAGSININQDITSSSGKLNVTMNAGSIIAFGTSVITTLGGNISLTAAGDITGLNLTSSTPSLSANAGSISLTSTGGQISFNNLFAEASVVGPSGNGGAVTLSAASDISIAGQIATDSVCNVGSASGNGGAVSVTSTGGAISINNISAYTFGDTGTGNAGTVNLSAATTLTLSTIDAYAYATTTTGTGANVTLSSGGDLTAQAISTWSVGYTGNSGNGGSISLTSSSGAISADALDTRSGDALNVALDSANGGNITLNAGTSVTLTSTVKSSSEAINGNSGNAGNISITAGTGITGRDSITAQSEALNTAGNGGNISLIANNGNILLRTLALAPKNVVSLSAGASTGNGGAISISASGSLLMRDISSYASASGNGVTAGNGGNVTVTTGGNLTTRIIESSSAGYSGSGATGGNISLTSGGDLDVNDVRSYSLGNLGTTLNAGNVTISATSGSIVTGGIDAQSNASGGDSGSGGSITLMGGTGLTLAGTIVSSSTSANNNATTGGAIYMSTQSGGITTSGSDIYSMTTGFGTAGTGGLIQLIAGSGNITLHDVYSDSYGGAGNSANGGAISISSGTGNVTGNIFQTDSLSGSTAANGGTLTINSGGTITAFDVESISSGVGAGTSGNINLTAPTQITITSLLAADATGTGGHGGTITLTSDQININMGALASGPFTADLVLQPYTSSLPILIGVDSGSSSILDISNTTLSQMFANGMHSITIGSANGSGDITVGVDPFAPQFTDPLILRSPMGSANIILNKTLAAVPGSRGSFTLAAGGHLINNIGGNSIQPAAGQRFLVYTADNQNTLNGLTFNFEEVGSYPNLPTGSGNGFIYKTSSQTQTINNFQSSANQPVTPVNFQVPSITSVQVSMTMPDPGFTISPPSFPDSIQMPNVSLDGSLTSLEVSSMDDGGAGGTSSSSSSSDAGDGNQRRTR